jgi:hypothetical protein
MNENVNQNDIEIVDKKCIGCSLSATSLQCPNCLKLGKSDSYVNLFILILIIIY